MTQSQDDFIYTVYRMQFMQLLFGFIIFITGDNLMKAKTATKMWLVISGVLFFAIFKATGSLPAAFNWVKSQVTGK